MDYRERREYLLNKEKVCPLDKEELYELTFGNNIFYKNQYISLVLKEEGKTDDEYYADILDTNGDFITYISSIYIDETIDDLKQCKTDEDICQYLIESGIIDYAFSKEDFMSDNFDTNNLDDLFYKWEDIPKSELLQDLKNNDYINIIGNYYVRCA